MERRTGEHGGPNGRIGAGQARCVVLHPRGSSVPPALARALEHRAIQHEATDEPMLALARLVRARDGGVALLIANAERCVEAPELVRAAERFVPRAVCWTYEPDAGEPLRAVTEADVAAWAGGARAPAPAPAGGERTLRLTRPPMTTPDRDQADPEPWPRPREDADADDAPKMHDPADRNIADSGEDIAAIDEPGAVSGRTVLTDEELAMLLADDDVRGGLR